ncbi:ATP-grasp domain-containing protein [Clostridium cibarium]|uniref:ATP-grasp domain-containing protein n=1 Tax=Clostridium cibarium TaxID=2762247 RepID=A0ABR8PUD5_9CLOT|nr:ATP-grasp domain-containing protein [Clostridium cibarium]MBD7911774.1 ATP-grasp domain-containing protein [Clostridium cibarium]
MKIAIIGANEYQNKLILKCKEKNIETHVFAWEDGAIGKENADFFYPVSIIEKDIILEKCKEIGIDGVLSVGSDLAMLTVNYISDKMNLVGNTMLCTVLSTNKYRMREAFLKNRVKSPKYCKVSGDKQYEDILLQLSLPVIVKPTDRSGSRGVTKVEKEDDLKFAIELALNESFNKEIIVEEYIGGIEYSMEFFTDKGKHSFLAITEKFTTGSPHFIERAHLQPGTIGKEVLISAIDTAIKGLNALEIQDGASHVEIKVQDKVPYIIEIGARMGGDFIGSDLVKLSTGIDFTELVMDKALGNYTEIKRRWNKYSFVFFIFNLDDMITIKENYSVLEPFIVEKELKESDGFANVTDSSNRHGYIIFQFESYEEFKNIEKILLGVEENER